MLGLYAVLLGHVEPPGRMPECYTPSPPAHRLASRGAALGHYKPDTRLLTSTSQAPMPTP